ncbi:hypothetical protein ACJ41O_005365 [Fusarium nematophilum]
MLELENVLGLGDTPKSVAGRHGEVLSNSGQLAFQESLAGSAEFPNVQDQPGAGVGQADSLELPLLQLSQDTYINESTLNQDCVEINLLASFGIPTAQSSAHQLPTRDSRFESFAWHPPLTWDEMPESEMTFDKAHSDQQMTSKLTELSPSLAMPSNLLAQRNISTALGNDEDWVKYVFGFPQMMLKAGTYPPFVHPTVYRCSEGEVLESLAIAFCCLGSYNAAMRSSQHFVYSLINRERDQLVKDFPRICSSKSDVWVLASVHAMCVYQIVGFFGASLEQARNAQLQQPWLLKMTRHLARINGQAKASLFEPSTWEVWALGESIRRTILLANTINVLSCRVGRQDPYMYEALDDALVSVLRLPAPSGLWKAKSAAEWDTQKMLMTGDDVKKSQATLGEAFESLSQGCRDDGLDGLDQYTRLVLDTLHFEA